jgi:hypothetical protein
MFLPTNYRYRKNIKDVSLLRLSGEELYDVVLKYGDIVFGFQSGKQMFPSFSLTHN